MKKNFACLLLAMMLMMTMACAIAEPVSSRTVADLASSKAIETKSKTTSDAIDGVMIYVSILDPETPEELIFTEIVAISEENSIVQYFVEEVQTEMVMTLPENTDIGTLEMDEFFQLDQEGYQEELGDLTATFEFVTSYEEDAVLLPMIGLLNMEKEETVDKAEITENTEKIDIAEDAEDDPILWVPLQATVVDGKVCILFTQETLAMMCEQEAVLMILRSNQPEVV